MLLLDVSHHKHPSHVSGWSWLLIALIANFLLFRTAIDALDPTISNLRNNAAEHRAASPSSQNVITIAQPASLASDHQLAAVSQVWDTVWRADSASAIANEGYIHAAVALRDAADAGDLAAAAQLVGAANWCVSAGPLAMTYELIGGERRDCVQYFGSDIDSRAALRAALFRWTMRLANAGLGDATLYASVLTRELTAVNPVVDPAELSQEYAAQLMGQLIALSEKGSADAASELNAHYAGASSLNLRDESLAMRFAARTEQLDPLREGLIASTLEFIRNKALTPEAK